MYTLIFESNYIEHIVQKHIADIDQCEICIAYFCKEHNKAAIVNKSWYDDVGRLVYDVGLDDEFFLCIKEK